jgi:hypothetical protein
MTIIVVGAMGNIGRRLMDAFPARSASTGSPGPTSSLPWRTLTTTRPQ